MPGVVSVFLDASGLFSGIGSADGGARLILKLGEIGLMQLRVSRHVLVEIENVIRRKVPELLPDLAIILDRAGIELVPAPSKKIVETCRRLVPHDGDALVLAAAWSAQIQYFVSLDKKHFLSNAKLKKEAPFPIGTPGDCLAWYRDQLMKP